MSTIIITYVVTAIGVTCVTAWNLWNDVAIMRNLIKYEDKRYYPKTKTREGSLNDIQERKKDVKVSFFILLAGLVWPVALVAVAAYAMYDLFKGVREAWK